MKVITAVEPIEMGYPSVFLAGGITNCPEWQDVVIKKLVGRKQGTLLNPRRKNFPIDDPNAAKEQIMWEFEALTAVDIFSMWFSNAPSDQPICMYELGRYLVLKAIYGDLDRVAIGIETGYKRESDVRIQTELIDTRLATRISSSLEEHVVRITEILDKLEAP